MPDNNPLGTTASDTAPSQNLLDLFVAQVSSQPPSPTSLDERAFYEKHQHDLANSNQNMEERKRYAECIYIFTCVWCICILFILLWKGFGTLDLSDEVIITLIGSTTINVFVFFRLVTKYLFNADKST